MRASFLEDVAPDRTVLMPSSSSSRVRSWRPLVEVGIVTMLLALAAQTAVQSRVVEGSSMEPTLRDGERVLVDRVAYIGSREPRRGDVVVFRAWPRRMDPFDSEMADAEDFIKRVIAIPGDVIEVRDGRVIVNGRTLDEKHSDQPTVGEVDPLVVAGGEYFVLGDNRNNSSDSRLFGTLSEDRIVGRAWARYWPFGNAGRMR